MSEMASKNARIEELTAQVNKLSLNMPNQGGSYPNPQPQPRYGQNQQYGQNRQYGQNYGPNQYGQNDGPNQGGQYSNNRKYPGPPLPQFAPRQNFSNACSICGEQGHWRNDCATLSDLVQKGIVHIKDDRKIYLGRNGDRMVNKAGNRTIAEAAIDQHKKIPTSSAIMRIEDLGSCGANSIFATAAIMDDFAEVDMAEKRKPVQLVAPQKRQAMDGAFQRVTRSQTVPPPPTGQPPVNVPPVIVPPALRAPPPPAPQVQIPSSIPPPPAPPQRTYPFSTVHPPMTFAPKPRIQDLTMEDVETQSQNARVPRERRAKVWTNWQLGAREKLCSRGPQDLTMMVIQSLMNPTVWNWLWDDKDAVVTYIGEDETIYMYREAGEVFSAHDAVDTLCLHRKLPCGFFRGPTPYLVALIGVMKEAHYALVDTGSQVNIISERLAIQLNLPVEKGSPLELQNASGGCISVVGVCRDVDISTVGRRSLQTFLVTSTNANDLLLELPWFMSVGARMIVAGKGPAAQVAISIVTGAPHQYSDQRYWLKDGRYCIPLTILSP